MNELQKRGGQLLYDRNLIVYRRPRPTLPAFCRMLLNYGRGRAEQFRLHPTFGSAANFVPPLFCLYLVLLPFLGKIGLAPLAFYFLVVAIQTVATTKNIGLMFRVAPLIGLTHVFYSLG